MGDPTLAGDVRALRASQLAKDANGMAWFTERGKTGKPVGGALNDRTLAALHAYLEIIGIELHDDAFIFRNRSGAPYSSDTLGDDFRDVRIAVFGDGEAHPCRLSPEWSEGSHCRGGDTRRAGSRYGKHTQRIKRPFRHLLPREPDDNSQRIGRSPSRPH